MERSIWKRSTLEAQGAKGFEFIKPVLNGYLFRMRYGFFGDKYVLALDEAGTEFSLIQVGGRFINPQQLFGEPDRKDVVSG